MKKRLAQSKEWLFLDDEQGQAIVIIAFAVIALVLFAGLALDAATIYAGQTKLKRAVDAAALAGVVELPIENAAAARTRQFMLGNGFNINDASLFIFDEIGLKSQDGLLLTHITFSPIQKSANRIIEVVYTLRVRICE